MHECWKLDELAKCFGVFLVNFCVAKVKQTTNILTSAEQHRQITGNNGTVTKATFLRRVVCFESLSKDKASRTIHVHSSMLLTEPLPSVNSQFECVF